MRKEILLIYKENEDWLLNVEMIYMYIILLIKFIRVLFDIIEDKIFVNKVLFGFLNLMNFI